MSRARLGLYIFARIPLFSNCFELTPAFSILTQRPTKLHLFPQEFYPTKRLLNEDFLEEPVIFEEMPQMVSYVYSMYMAKIQSLEAANKEAKAAAIEKSNSEPNAPEAGSAIGKRDKVEPTPIVFEETFVLEKPAEVFELPVQEDPPMDVEKAEK